MDETIEADFIVEAPDEDPDRPPVATGWECIVFVLEDDGELP